MLFVVLAKLIKKIIYIFRYIRIVGVRNTANRIFHLVSMEVRYTHDKYELSNNGLIIPHYNVASIQHSSFVLEGVSRSRNALINGGKSRFFSIY